MTEKQVLLWIHRELVPLQLKAMDVRAQTHPGQLYTTDLLSAMTMREVGVLLMRYIQAGMKPRDMWPIMKGDYSQRPGEREKSYHGFSVMQIDIGSFPDFVKSGAWKDPVKSYVKAMEVLDGKRAYIQGKHPDQEGEALLRASVAAYNCGEGWVVKILSGKVKDRQGAVVTDIDYCTHGRDYSRDVFRLRDLYNSLPEVSGL